MINGRFISRILGLLLQVIAIFLLICAAVAWGYGEEDLEAFLLSALITMASGGIMMLFGRKAPQKFSIRDGYFIVSATWALWSLAGTLPFLLGGYQMSFSAAYYECMSAFTSTGFTAMDNIDSLPHGILFWRSLMQWIGGLGIVFFTIAILPYFGGTGVHLFAAEMTGPTKDKLHPRVAITSRRIWAMYIAITLLEAALLRAGGMPLFDSFCHSLCTTATGGFSTQQAGMSVYDSAYIQYVVSIFMFVSGINFVTLYSLFSSRRRKRIQGDEVKWYTGSTLLCTLFIACALVYFSGRDWEPAFRAALFQVTSIHTSTGFTSEDLTVWPSCTWFPLVLLMISGASSGSTTGGAKCIRLLILYRAVRNEFRRIVHPNAVLPLRIGKQPIGTQTVLTVFICIFLYVGFSLFFAFLCMESGYSFVGSISYCAGCIGNTGAAFGEFGGSSCSFLSPAWKWASSFMMLVGRLEFFTILLLFTPQFWKHQ